jgi:hypothetical protein
MRPMFLILPCLAALAGCGDPGARSPDPIAGDGARPSCADGDTYPEGAVEPMTVGEVLTPYSWPDAIDRATRERFALDLALAPCNVDPNVDWSPADVLLFVSVPAW